MSLALMYHDVVEDGAEDASGFPGRDAARYKVTRARFADHLRAIRAAGATPTITFDDGGVSAVEAAALLEPHGFRGHFFVTVDYLGTKGFLTPRAIRELRQRGHIVGSHSCSHPLRMGHCSWTQLCDEWARSRAALEDILGEQVRVGSVPGGDYAPAVARAAEEAGFTELFTSEPTGSVGHLEGLTVRGRFTVQRRTSAKTVAAVAAGAWAPVAGQAAVWNVKKLGKRLIGVQYLHLRRVLLRHGDEVRWGDRRVIDRVDDTSST